MKLAVVLDYGTSYSPGRISAHMVAYITTDPIGHA